MNENYDETNAYQVNQIEEELIALRKKDRTKNIVFGLVAGIAVALGAGFYISNAVANDSYWDNYAQGGYNAQYAGTSAAGGGCGGGGGTGGGGCGGGSATGTAAGTTAGATGISNTTTAGDGCCGGSGTAATPESLAELEKQGLALYKEEAKDSNADVTAKASDRGCHTQIDIADSQGNIVRSYGYQGSGLYVIN